MIKSLHKKEFNKELNEGVAHLQSFPGSKANEMDHHAIPILEEHQCGTYVYIYMYISDLYISDGALVYVSLVNFLCKSIVQEEKCDDATIDVGINDLPKSHLKINISEIAKGIINIALRCRSHNIATISISSIIVT